MHAVEYLLPPHALRNFSLSFTATDGSERSANIEKMVSWVFVRDFRTDGMTFTERILGALSAEEHTVPFLDDSYVKEKFLERPLCFLSGCSCRKASFKLACSLHELYLARHLFKENSDFEKVVVKCGQTRPGNCS